MGSRRLIVTVASFCLFTFISIAAAYADPSPAPLEYFYGLVAGEGTQGNRDGEFQQALFGRPAGIALSDDESTLYVSDEVNRSIRTIALGRKNDVSTLAGREGEGALDGPFQRASFAAPRNLVMLPGQILAVYDFGDGTLRRIYLKDRAVQTWFRLNKQAPPHSTPDPVAEIYDMVYQPSEKTLYFSQPQLRRIMKCSDDQTEPVPAAPSMLEGTRPGPLALLEGRVVVGDLESGSIYPLESLQNTQTAAVPIAKAANLCALTGVGKTLYALPREGEKILRPLDNTFTYLPTSEGDATTVTAPAHPYFFRFQGAFHPQWIASRHSEKKFFITSAQNPVGVFYFKDYNYTALPDRWKENSQGLSDFEYPLQKPPQTFRIMLIGDSHTFAVMQTGSRPVPEYSRMLCTPKRLEWYLNSKAAMAGSTTKFEVLLLAHGADNVFPIALWPYYLAPEKIKAYDADLVLLMTIPQLPSPCEFWFDRPISDEGLPTSRPDGEYYQKPWAVKAPPGTERRHYLDLCLKHKLAQIGENGFSIHFKEANEVIREPEIYDDLVSLTGKPLGMLKKKISAFRTQDGAPVRFAMCFAPLTTQSLEDYGHFWRGVAGKFSIPLIDLTPKMTALRDARIPGSDQGHEHFSPDGHDLIARILADSLIRERWIPLNP